MNPVMQAKLAGAAAILILLGLGLWYLRHDGYEAGKTEVQSQWNAERAKIEKDRDAKLSAYADKLKKAEAQHDQDQFIIAQLADDARRVRIHLPACPGAAQAGAGADGAAGVLSARVDQSFAELQDRAGELFARCDQLNIDAIRANGSR